MRLFVSRFLAGRPASISLTMGVLGVATSLLLSACSTAAAPTAAIAPTAAPTSAPIGAPTTAPAAAPTAASTPAAPKVAAATVAPAGARRLALVAGQSEVTVRVKEHLAGLSAPSDAVLKTSAVDGQIALGPGSEVLPDGSKLTVDLSSLKSDEARRDRFIKGDTLATARFPNAEFVPTALRVLTGSLPQSGKFEAELTGNMTIRGVTKPVTFHLTGSIENGTTRGIATTQFKLTDHGIPLPKVAMVLSVEDLVRLEVSFTAAG